MKPFKNVVFYKLPKEWAVDLVELENRLLGRPLLACGPFEMSSRGWVVPAYTDRYVHVVNNRFWHFSLGVNEKILPSSVIKQRVDAQAKKIADEQGYPVGKRQLRELKQSITDDLCKQALTKTSYIRAYIDCEHQLLVVEASSYAKAEILVEHLRDTLGSFAVSNFETRFMPSYVLGTWATGFNYDSRFVLEDFIELASNYAQGVVVRYSKESIDRSRVNDDVGKKRYITKLGLTYAEELSFIACENLQLKRLKFLKFEATPENEERSKEEEFDASFTIMADAISSLIVDLIEAFGGEA